MDPYLERHWLDVHTGLIAEARRHLNRVLPPGLIARAEERIAVESGEEYVRHLGPDVRVVAPGHAAATEADVAVIEAPYLLADSEPITERFIRIVDEAGRLVTVIEVLSPGNKREPGMTDYRTKRRELLASGVHLVEIDLIRAGDWRALMAPERCPAGAESPYRAIVRTAGRRPRGYLFPLTFRDPLPDVPVPLRAGERPVALPLQTMLDTVYQDGRYDQTIAYSRQPEPALEGADWAWLQERLERSRA
jgi:hypothetical protein